MSQYGNTAKNPPWVRADMGLGQNMGVGQANTVNQSLMANPLQATTMLQYPFQQQQAAMGMNMPGLTQPAVTAMPPPLATSQMYGGGMGAVSYPTRALNSAAFQTQPPQAQQQQPTTGKQRVFTGTVTKTQDNFGFVDEDVFFQSSCCVKGSSPQVGDRVLVEAVYNANMPFKWNATRIQVLPKQDMSAGRTAPGGYTPPVSGSNYSAVPPPKSQQQQNQGSPGGRNRFGGSRFSGGGGGNGGGGGALARAGRMNSRNLGGRRGGRERDKDRDEPDRKRRRDRDSSRDRDEKEKAKSPPPKKRSKTPPPRQPRKQRRVVPRYSVTVPRTSLNSCEGDVVEIKKRYANLYIPSDFFLTVFRWTQTFPLTNPISLDSPCSFHVMHKDVDPILPNDAVLEPPDADYLFSAKVMLLGSPGLEELYAKCTTLAEDQEGGDDDGGSSSGGGTSHPSKLLQFLVGLRGGKEMMALGGPWSPSLDGPDPANNQATLIKTAVRTVKALTGIDLSPCGQWFRFLEVFYHRGETVRRGKCIPARVETVVIFVPDVWSCLPTRLEWDGLQHNFTKALSRKLTAPDQKDEEDKQEEEKAKGAEEEKKGQEAEKGQETPKKEPRHYSELDVKTMKITDLREELEVRNLSPKGIKSQLAARLSKVLKTEEEDEKKKEEQKKKEEAAAAAMPPPTKTEPARKEDEEKRKKDDDKKKIDDKERQQLERRYRIPENPHILVHPNRTAKSGKFDCSVVSLNSLLGYRQDDTKEHSFEVSIFAELFKEMLMRDFGFNIYCAIVEAPEKPKEDKEKDAKGKDDKDSKGTEDKDAKSKDAKDSKSRDDKDSKKDDKEKSKDDEKDKDRNKKDSKPKEKDKDTKEKDKEDRKERDSEMDVDEEKNDADSGDEDREDSREGRKERKERGRLITADRHLLLSFCFFDTTRVGYFYDRDAEDLLFSLGLTLSRSQVKKLVSKVTTKDVLNYRRLTDKPEEEVTTEATDVNSVPSAPVDHKGNKALIPFEKEDNGKGEKKTDSNDGLVMYKGSLVMIEKVMEQLSRSEAARLDTDRSIVRLKADYNKLKESSLKSERHIKELTGDVRDLKDKLSTANNDLITLQTKQHHYQQTLTDIHDKIRPLIKTEEDKEQQTQEMKSPDESAEIKQEVEVKSESAKEKSDEVQVKSEEAEVKSEDSKSENDVDVKSDDAKANSDDGSKDEAMET